MSDIPVTHSLSTPNSWKITATDCEPDNGVVWHNITQLSRVNEPKLMAAALKALSLMEEEWSYAHIEEELRRRKIGVSLLAKPLAPELNAIAIKPQYRGQVRAMPLSEIPREYRASNLVTITTKSRPEVQNLILGTWSSEEENLEQLKEAGFLFSAKSSVNPEPLIKLNALHLGTANHKTEETGFPAASNIVVTIAPLGKRIAEAKVAITLVDEQSLLEEMNRYNMGSDTAVAQIGMFNNGAPITTAIKKVDDQWQLLTDIVFSVSHDPAGNQQSRYLSLWEVLPQMLRLPDHSVFEKLIGQLTEGSGPNSASAAADEASGLALVSVPLAAQASQASQATQAEQLLQIETPEPEPEWIVNRDTNRIHITELQDSDVSAETMWHNVEQLDNLYDLKWMMAALHCLMERENLSYQQIESGLRQRGLQTGLIAVPFDSPRYKALREAKAIVIRSAHIKTIAGMKRENIPISYLGKYVYTISTRPRDNVIAETLLYHNSVAQNYACLAEAGVLVVKSPDDCYHIPDVSLMIQDPRSIVQRLQAGTIQLKVEPIPLEQLFHDCRQHCPQAKLVRVRIPDIDVPSWGLAIEGNLFQIVMLDPPGSETVRYATVDQLRAEAARSSDSSG